MSKIQFWNIKLTRKKVIITIVILIILFFGSILYRNISTYNSMKRNVGYTYGTIVKVWDSKNGYRSRYQYVVGGDTFRGRQGERYKLHDTVLIVYDTTNPRFSMVADYSLPIVIDSNNKVLELDTSQVDFCWKNYLPGDGVNSIKDLWCLD